MPRRLNAFCRGILSRDESERAARFYFERDRMSYIAGRAAMRVILAGYLNLAPEKVTFCYGARGKPTLDRGLHQAGLMFNLSHSRNCALLAVTRDANIGVDIEFIKDECMTLEIANRFFSKGEINTLKAIDSERQKSAFFSCWTRKEAYIKALGEGLFHPLSDFDVAFGDKVTPALLRVQAYPADIDRWRIYNIDIYDQYAAAVVVEGNEHALESKQWDWQEEVLAS